MWESGHPGWLAASAGWLPQLAGWEAHMGLQAGYGAFKPDLGLKPLKTPLKPPYPAYGPIWGFWGLLGPPGGFKQDMGLYRGF